MEHDYILYEKKEQIAYITINRPESLNAVHPPANKEMLEVFSDFRDDHKLRVAILTGSGNRAFCAGDDLKYQVKHGKPGEPYPEYNEYPLGGITHDFKCWKPIIGAVNGYALGGGMELALGCDILIAVEHAKFGLPDHRSRNERAQNPACTCKLLRYLDRPAKLSENKRALGVQTRTQNKRRRVR